MKKPLLLLLSGFAATLCLAAEPTFTIDAAHPSGKVSPTLYGLMTEEISHSYDGGLYAELIQNRAFLDDASQPVHWTVVESNGAAATIALDQTNPYNDALTTSLRLTVSGAAKGKPAGVANDGYWGIPVQPNTRYRVEVLARTGAGFSGPLTASIVSDDGHEVYATTKISGLTAQSKKFEVVLKTGKVVTTSAAHFELTIEQPGTVWLNFVSLFPPTWNDRPNGLRKDLMQMMVDLNPKFLRCPGGNYLEGDTAATRFDWKKTIGPIEERHGHEGPWGYRSTDGLGLLEFLEWCEDMKAQPVLAVYSGYSLKGAHINAGPDLQPYVQDALDEIEYVTGDTSTKWGAQRTKDGHPAPFPLKYVEVGNEDWFDRSGSYDGRFVQFHDAIKARYPQLIAISTIGNDQPATARVHSVQPEMTDEHYYRPADDFVRTSPDYAAKYDRHGPEIFVGEWAAYEDAAIKPWEPGAKGQPPTPAMKSAIGDAAFMAAMERNSDIILMQSYAPMFVNVNPGARQWRPNLIGYNATAAYGSPSYYAIQLFSRNVGDEILPVTPAGTAVQGCATRDGKTGEIFVKLVNPEATDAALNLSINGVKSLAAKGTATVLAGNPEDSNSIDNPRKLAPATTALTGLKPEFTYTVPAHGIVVLKLNAR
jgi:alpha-N-arabinofuranosidase